MPTARNCIRQQLDDFLKPMQVWAKLNSSRLDKPLFLATLPNSLSLGTPLTVAIREINVSSVTNLPFLRPFGPTVFL
ncbi:hypothetical protein Q31b_33810 [Novipirellula aureliae]|uniref:Uncharacterized protein n=1 Tax=Novipirellula aureliae TaxID=2527966 RepID=A0A5C6DVU0_9BACT|nr:hypothetical protein Q31b_33810 [Novipirellula aureliae]